MQNDFAGQLHFLGVDLEDSLPALDIGAINLDRAIKAARTQQGRIEDFGAIGRTHQNDPGIGVESIQFGQQLIERLLALVVTTEGSRPPRLAQCI